jgi:Fuc2NAc and GlcNAc transferase
MNQLLLMACCFGATLIGVEGVRRWAYHRQVLDIPNGRSSHTRPTPRGGWLAIVGTVLIAVTVEALAAPDWPALTLICFLGGLTLVAVIGWLDDLHSLTSRLRLVVQLVAALLLLVGAVRLISPGPVNPAIAVGYAILGAFWLVGLTNAYNFMDGIDGIAAGQAVVAGVGWALVGAITQQPFVSVVGLIVAAACLGFLFHNWPPARIFMGDVSSGFLGCMFGFLALGASKGKLELFAAGAALVWPFLFDTTFTLLRRLCHKENIFAAHRSHLYQRLVLAGLNHQSVTLLYLVLALTGLGGALLLSRAPESGWLVMAALAGLACALWKLVVHIERKMVKTQDAKTAASHHPEGV